MNKINHNNYKALSIELPSCEDSEILAKHLADGLHAPMVITLSGQIGSGKTTLVRSILQTLGVQSAIKSPTYTLVESYQVPRGQIHHFDMYRIQDEHEVEYIGFRDYFSKATLCFIEWPEHIKDLLSQVDLHVHLFLKNSGRQALLESHTKKGKNMLINLAEKL